MSNEEFEKSIQAKDADLRKIYTKVIREVGHFPYKNDVLDENLNLLVKVNNENQR
ncbi:MAG: hypothetical protein ACI4N3_04925 [Alphaproteobacteria bacterium]